MIADIQSFPPGTTIDADLCIIGAGAAGITIARQFIDSDRKVVLLESGGYKRERGTQQLYCGDSVGERYYKPLDECRSRFLGGSTNCWGGICTPLSPIDFEERSWVPYSGWPITFDEVERWVRRAHPICGPGPYVYDGEAWKLIGLSPETFDHDLFVPFVWHFNNRWEVSFGKRFRTDLEESANTQVLLHANATELLTDESGRVVERVRTRTLGGQTNYIRAKAFVLACGGIENPRLMLASCSAHPNGLGNDRDLVGRFFQEHLQMRCGILHTAPGSQAAAYSVLSRLGPTWCLPGLVLPREVQVANRTLNGSVAIDPFHDPDGALESVQTLREDLKAGKVGSRTLNRLWKIAMGSPKLLQHAWGRFVRGERPKGDPDRFHVYCRAEQTPNPDSRVRLSDEVDALGMRRAVLDWQTVDDDRKALRLMVEFARKEFRRVGLGEIVDAEWLATGKWPDDIHGGPHHMGTTRMSDDPATGVVDRDCRVHGLDGLYIAGSSIFPTGGHANPTLTIVALALRLAEHLRHTLDSSPIVEETAEPVSARQ